MDRKARKKRIGILGGILFVMAVACICYVNDYYRSEVTVQEYERKNAAVQLTEIENGLFLDGEGADSGLLFGENALQSGNFRYG